MVNFPYFFWPTNQTALSFYMHIRLELTRESARHTPDPQIHVLLVHASFKQVLPLLYPQASTEAHEDQARWTADKMTPVCPGPTEGSQRGGSHEAAGRQGGQEILQATLILS